MQRATVLSSVVVLLLAACSANADRSTSFDPVAEPATTIEAIPSTTSTAQSTTTSEPMGPVDICRGRAEVWESGGVYLAECFVVPVSFQSPGEGWVSSSVGDSWLVVRWMDPADSEVAAWMGMLPFRHEETPSVVVDEILSVEGISLVPGSERETVTLGSWAGVRVDVAGAEDGPSILSGSGCTTGQAVMFNPHTGHELGSTGNPSLVIGVGACHVVRVWVVEVEDRSMTILGGTVDPDRHQEAVAKIEELFEGMSFDPGGG